jgi:hypothetical protein
METHLPLKSSPPLLATVVGTVSAASLSLLYMQLPCRKAVCKILVSTVSLVA